VVLGVIAPKTWADAVALVKTIDLADPDLITPAWIFQVEGSLGAPPGGTAETIATQPAGTLGVLCATGTFPDLTFHDGGSFVVGG
jgi:hypothetical protein